MTNTNTLELTRAALTGRLQRAVRHSILTLESTPSEKLDYKPTDTAKSVIELAQHIIVGNNLCLTSLGLAEAGNPTASRVEELAVGLNESGTKPADFAANCTEEKLEGSVDFFGRPVPMTTFLMIGEWHISRHAGQIDYLQTTWNDMEDRF